MLKGLLDSVTSLLGEKFTYFKIVIKSIIALTSIFIFYFLRSIIPTEFSTHKDSISVVITILMITLYFINEERRFNFKFLQYFNDSFMERKKYKEIFKFKEKVYSQNTKKIIVRLFDELKIKAGYFALIDNEESSLFCYRKDKVYFIEQELNLSYATNFLNGYENYIYLIDQRDREMSSFLKMLSSNCVLSMKFKNELIGFLCFNKSKNYHLSSKIHTTIQEKSILFRNLMINRYDYQADKFKNEIKKAKISSQFIKNITIPSIKDVKIGILDVKDELLEFHQNRENIFYFVLASFDSSTQTKSLIMSYIAGLSFSLRYQSSKEIFKIKSVIKESFINMKWKNKEGIIIGQFESKLKTIKLDNLGDRILVFQKEEKNLNQRVWTFQVKNREILSISQLL